MIESSRIARFLTNHHLGLILMPTEQCNFRCTYCYEDFAIGKMSKSTIQGVKNLILKRGPELKSLAIDWFGGEPLAGKDVIYEIGSYVQELIKNQFPQIIYKGAMTTNGFLLKGQTLRKMLDLNIRSYQISLDGPKEIHDKTRVRIDQSGSFDAIWANLLAMREVPDEFKVTLRVHVTPENYQALDGLVSDIQKEFGHDARFGVFFKAISNLGGENGGTFQTLKGKERSEILENLYAKLQPDKNISPFRANQEPYVCYTSKPNHLVIRANGSIAKCTVVFNDDRNSLGKIHEDGTLDIDQEKLQLWVRGIQTQDEKTMHCPLHGLPQLNKENSQKDAQAKLSEIRVAVA